MMTINARQDWWVSCPLDDINHDTVMTFRADGHELQMIYLAMEKARVGAGGKVYFRGGNGNPGTGTKKSKNKKKK